MNHSDRVIKWGDNGIEVISKKRALATAGVEHHEARAAALSYNSTGNEYEDRKRYIVAVHHGKRARNERERADRLLVLKTHYASIVEMTKAALKALDSHDSAAQMRQTVKHCQMRLCILMDEADAAARALIEVDAADEE
jgi:hypothetical protein